MYQLQIFMANVLHTILLYHDVKITNINSIRGDEFLSPKMNEAYAIVDSWITHSPPFPLKSHTFCFRLSN